MGLGVRGWGRDARRGLLQEPSTRLAKTLAATAVVAAACGGGGGGDEQPAAAGEPASDTSADVAAVPPCSQERHVVAMDVAGFLTSDSEQWAAWITDPEADPDPRPGAAQLTHAYRERGYELLYLTAAPPELMIGGVPAPPAVQGWLESNGFVSGDGTRVYGYTGDDLATGGGLVGITNELVRLGSEGVHVDAAYTDDEHRVYAFASGGVPQVGLYTIGPDAGISGTTPIPDDDLEAHRATIEGLPPVCATG